MNRRSYSSQQDLMYVNNAIADNWSLVDDVGTRQCVCVCRQKSFPRRVCPSKPSFSSEMSAHGAVPLCSVALLMMLMEKYTTADKKNVTYGVTTEVRLCWERMNCTSFAVISHKKFISYGITNMRQVIMCHCASNYMCC